MNYSGGPSSEHGDGDHHVNHHHHRPPPPPDGHHPHHHHHPPNQNHNGPPAKWHSFKLLVDPHIHRGAVKMVRYDGMFVPGNPHHIPPTPTDPRKKLPSALWKRLEALELPIPRFKIDANYVGEPPKVEVTIENLNDNVDKHFLNRMVEKFGIYEEMVIYYHPRSRKHLGLARIVFELVPSAKECVRNLHGKSVMGKQLSCYIDPFGASCKKMFQDLTEDPKPEPPPPPQKEPTPPPVETKQPEPVEEAPPASVPPSPPRRDSSSSRWDYSRENSRDRHRHEPSPDRDYHRGHEGRRAEYNHGRDWSEERDRDRDWRGHHRSYSSSRDRRRSSRQSQEDYQDSSHKDTHYQPTPFDPQYTQPDFWMKQAQEYAKAAVQAASDLKQIEPSESPEVPHQMPNNENKSSRNSDVEDDDGDNKMDLDTRLEMLRKGRSGMPLFLLNELGAESESEKEDAAPEMNALSLEAPQPFVEEPPLSRAPSPFLSSDHYLQCHKEWVEELRKESTRKSKQKGRASSRNSDQMSLSSLSSDDNKILEQGPEMAVPAGYPPYGYYDATGVSASFPGQPGAWPMYGADPYQQWQYPGVPGGGASGQYMGYQEGHWDGHQWTDDPYGDFKNKSDHNTFRATEKASVNLVVKELKRTLTKDMNKRMCETLAFYLYDKWWTEQEQKYKDRQAAATQGASAAATSGSSTSTAPTTTSEAKNDNEKTIDPLPRVPKAEDLTSIFDKQRETMESAPRAGTGTFGVGGSLGFGFRGTIPKLPSFKMKRKQRTPEKDSKGQDSSDDEDGKDDRRKGISRKRLEQEKRREKRLEKEKEDKKRKSESDKTDKKKPAKGKTTIDSIYSALYSDASDIESSDSDVKSSPVKRKKEIASSKGSSSKDQSVSASSLSEASESGSEASVASKAASSSAGSTKSSSSSSSSSSSGSGSSSSGSSSSDEEEKTSTEASKRTEDAETSEATKKEEEEMVVDVEDQKSSSSTDTASEDEKEEPLKKPAPIKVRTPSAKASIDDHVHVDSPPHIADHCYARPVKSQLSEVDEARQQFATQFANDHGYTRPRTPPPSTTTPSRTKGGRKPSVPPPPPAAPLKPVQPKAKPKPQPVIPKKKFKQRDQKEQFAVVYKFLTKGIDAEDISYLKRSYEMMLNQNNQMFPWINDTHWVDHTITDIPDPPKKKRKGDFSRPHLTGCVRTEGYYKMDHREKLRTKYHLHRGGENDTLMSIKNMEGAVTKAKLQTAQSLSREARSAQRRIQTVLGEEGLNSDLLKFNQLKFRRKQMKFGKSAIHDWGLFAMEYIAPDEMVIEYVGSVVRPLLSDVREKRYEKQGIGSSYLFRIDLDYVVDATKCGNLARFINHSCDPNCYAKIITIDGEKKIVIYSKQAIAIGEEITYDYKFPLEDEKILCLCGSKNCRKYLN